VLGKEVRPLSEEWQQSLGQQALLRWFQDELKKAKVEKLVNFAEPVAEATPTP